MIGLVLEGGVARGAYHIGVVKAYLEAGYKFDGYAGTSVGAINAAMIAHGVHILGAGKNAAGDKIDYSVGVSEIKKVGTQVKQGEPLMMIHYNDESKLEQALEYFKNAYRLAPKRPTPPPLIVERVA